MASSVHHLREGSCLQLTTSVLVFGKCIAKDTRLRCLLTTASPTMGPGPPATPKQIITMTITDYRQATSIIWISTSVRIHEASVNVFNISALPSDVHMNWKHKSDDNLRITRDGNYFAIATNVILRFFEQATDTRNTAVIGSFTKLMVIEVRNAVIVLSSGSMDNDDNNNNIHNGGEPINTASSQASSDIINETNFPPDVSEQQREEIGNNILSTADERLLDFSRLNHENSYWIIYHGRVSYLSFSHMLQYNIQDPINRRCYNSDTKLNPFDMTLPSSWKAVPPDGYSEDYVPYESSPKRMCHYKALVGGMPIMPFSTSWRAVPPDCYSEDYAPYESSPKRMCHYKALVGGMPIMPLPSSWKAVPPDCYSEDYVHYESSPKRMCHGKAYLQGYYCMPSLKSIVCLRVLLCIRDITALQIILQIITYNIEVPIGNSIIEDDDECEQWQFSYTYHGRDAVPRMDIAADKSTWTLFGPPNAIRQKRPFGQLEEINALIRLYDKGVLTQFNMNDLKHRKQKRKNANRINKFASEITRTEDDYDEHILSLNLESIRAMTALRHMWSNYMMSSVLRKSLTLSMASVLYPEEEYLFYAYADESSNVDQDTNGYQRNYYCLPSLPVIVYLRVLHCIRDIANLQHICSNVIMSTDALRKSLTLGMTSVLYPEEEALIYAYSDESSNVDQDTNGYQRNYYCLPSLPVIVYLRVLHCIRDIANLQHICSNVIMSTDALRKSLTLGMTSVLYPEEEALVYAYTDESSGFYQDTIGYLRNYYCMLSPPLIVYLRVPFYIRDTGMNALMYPESMIQALPTSMEEDLYCASVDHSSDIYEDTALYLREDHIKTEEEEDMFGASAAASDVYYDANVSLKYYYRKTTMSNAFMPTSSYGGKDAINDEQDIITTITSDIIQCITLLLYYSSIEHRRFDARRLTTRLRHTKNLNRSDITTTPNKEQSCVKNTGGNLFNISTYNIFEYGLFFSSHLDCRESVSPIFYDTNLHTAHNSIITAATHPYIAANHPPMEERDTNRMKEAEAKRRKINARTKVTGTNAFYSLRDVKYFNAPLPCRISGYETNYKKHICHNAIGSVRIPAHNNQGFIDVDCYYFSGLYSTILLYKDGLHSPTNLLEYERQSIETFYDILEVELYKNSSTKPNEYERQSIEPFYDTLEDKLYRNPNDGTTAIDQGNCVPICAHRLWESDINIVTGSIRSGQCFAYQIIYLFADKLEANVTHSCDEPHSGFEQRGPTIIYIDNMSALKIINDNTSPTERTRHMDIRFFQVQDWRLDGDIIMKHIPGILNPSDDLTKPLGWVLHSRHCRRIMGHFEHV